MMGLTSYVVLLGTQDTKFGELSYIKNKIESGSPFKTHVIDTGRTSDIVKSTQTIVDFTKLDRGQYVTRMIDLVVPHLEEFLKKNATIGVIGIGGSTGTSLAAGIMRRVLPIGLPKLIVTTMASGDISHYVGETDISIMPSVVDIAGTNSILNGILNNAAGAIIGMATSYQSYVDKGKKSSSPSAERKRIGITMFGVTTPGVDAIRAHLESKGDFEIYVFHATGSGGRAMERLIREGQLDAVIDLTTTEIADELAGGVLTAGPDRLRAAAAAGIPQVLSVGACDMVNFGPRSSVPKELQERKLVEHNPSVTLMRTSAEESRRIGEFIVAKLGGCKRKDLVAVVLPTGGISMLAVRDGPFYDKEADEVLFDAVAEGLAETGIEVVRDERDINNEGFARMVGDKLLELLGR